LGTENTGLGIGSGTCERERANTNMGERQAVNAEWKKVVGGKYYAMCVYQGKVKTGVTRVFFLSLSLGSSEKAR